MKRIISLLFIIVAVSHVRGVSIGKCLDQLTASVTANSGAICPAMSEYMKCFMKESKLTGYLDSSQLTMLQNQLNTQLSAQGVSCDTDIQKLVREIQEEERHATGSTTTQRPPTFEEATSVGQCIDALTNVIIQNSGQTRCSDVNPYVKCVLRVYGVHTAQMSREQIRDLQSQLQEGLIKQGMSCTIDVQKSIDELNGKSGSDRSQNVHVVFTALFTLFSFLLASI